ncbi:hypothetical protein E6R39_08230 [Enterobacter hormaechei]|nr:hypothetical protein E6R39_08230 [Enterobacter hormaechei]
MGTTSSAHSRTKNFCANSAALTAYQSPRLSHNGNKLNRDERRQLMDRAIVLTVIEVARRGLVVPA